MRHYAILALLMLIAASAYAEDGQPTEPSNISLEFKQDTSNLMKFIFGSAIPIALIISYSIIALAYMASKVFMSHELGVWATVEMREALISTMYAALILALIPPINALINSFGGSGEKSFVDNANTVVNTAVVRMMGVISYSSMFSLAASFGWMPSAYYQAGILNLKPGFSLQIYNTIFYAASVFVMFANAFLPILFAAIMSLIGQYTLLLFLEKSLYVFVGLGLLLRAFTFTRRMGSTVIAIFLGGFIFLKLALAIESAIAADMVNSTSDDLFWFKSDEVDPTIGGKISLAVLLGLTSTYLLKGTYFILMSQICSAIASSVCAGPQFPVCFPIIMGFCTVILFPFLIFPLMLAVVYVGMIVPVLIGVVQLIEVMGKSLVISVIAEQLSDGIASQIAANSDLMAFAFFIPVFNIIFVLAGVKALVEAMGGDETVVHMLTFI